MPDEEYPEIEEPTAAEFRAIEAEADAATEDDEPEDEAEPEEAGITISQLHEELAAATSENRRGSRRVMEGLKHIAGTLDALSSTVTDLHRNARSAPASPSASAGASSGPDRSHLLALVELADRVTRVSTVYRQPPPTTSHWFPAVASAQATWAAAWQTQADAHSIMETHLRGILENAGLQRIEAHGQRFDPAHMTAVEAVTDAAKPDQTVLAEILPGYRHAPSGVVIRNVQVRVSRR